MRDTGFSIGWGTGECSSTKGQVVDHRYSIKAYQSQIFWKSRFCLQTEDWALSRPPKELQGRRWGLSFFLLEYFWCDVLTNLKEGEPFSKVLEPFPATWNHFNAGPEQVFFHPWIAPWNEGRGKANVPMLDSGQPPGAYCWRCWQTVEFRYWKSGLSNPCLVLGTALCAVYRTRGEGLQLNSTKKFFRLLFRTCMWHIVRLFLDETLNRWGYLEILTHRLAKTCCGNVLHGDVSKADRSLKMSTLSFWRARGRNLWNMLKLFLLSWVMVLVCSCWLIKDFFPNA